jgi:hypothetical protein
MTPAIRIQLCCLIDLNYFQRRHLYEAIFPITVSLQSTVIVVTLVLQDVHKSKWQFTAEEVFKCWSLNIFLALVLAECNGL